MLKEMVTTEEAAEMLGISPKRTASWLRQQGFKPVKGLQRPFRWRRAEIVAYVACGEEPDPARTLR